MNCTTDPYEAYLQMKAVYEQSSGHSFDAPKPKKGNAHVKTIHYIMSFADSENVSPELAFRIAKTLVIKAFGEDVQAVIAVHTDKSHVHAHFVINTYSLSGQKYNANMRSLHYVREKSNEVCKMFGVTPALNFENKGRSMQYNEWQHRKNGTSWKQQIRDEIDRLIPTVNSLDELLAILEEGGYEIKRGKYISIRAPGKERFVRTKTLGEEYTEDSLNIRINYRDIGSDIQPAQDNDSKLWAAYASVIGDVRILAEQHRKVPRKQNITMPYSADNDLDVYRLSAQLSVMNKEDIRSIGELEGKANEQKKMYEKYIAEINSHIEEYNKMVSLLEQAQTYYTLSKKTELSPFEQLRMNVCRQAMQNNNMLTRSDVDDLRERVRISGNKIAAIKEKIEGCRQKYEVFKDILETYDRLSKHDYVAELVEEERLRREKAKKKSRSR